MWGFVGGGWLLGGLVAGGSSGGSCCGDGGCAGGCAGSGGCRGLPVRCWPVPGWAAERLETRTRVVVGPPGHAWVVEVNPAGELTARHAETGAVTVLAAP